MEHEPPSANEGASYRRMRALLTLILHSISLQRIAFPAQLYFSNISTEIANNSSIPPASPSETLLFYHNLSRIGLLAFGTTIGKLEKRLNLDERTMNLAPAASFLVPATIAIVDALSDGMLNSHDAVQAIGNVTPSLFIVGLEYAIPIVNSLASSGNGIRENFKNIFSR